MARTLSLIVITNKTWLHKSGRVLWIDSLTPKRFHFVSVNIVLFSQQYSIQGCHDEISYHTKSALSVILLTFYVYLWADNNNP